jgi:hypothetical protein
MIRGDRARLLTGPTSMRSEDDFQFGKRSLGPYKSSLHFRPVSGDGLLQTSLPR